MDTSQTGVILESEVDALSGRVRSTWTAGDFGRIALGYEGGAAQFVARLGVGLGDRVLDVACGTGNLTLPAARTGAKVSGIDIAPNLLDQLARRASQEGLGIEIQEANCEALPYADASFDTVMSMFGVMFAARPELAAAELVRVCRSGGRIAMANWTLGSFVGDMLRTTASFAPPPAGTPSPLLWGSESVVRDRLGDQVVAHFTNRRMTFEYPVSPAEVVDLFRLWYGPTKRVFDGLDADAAAELRHQLITLWSENNRALDGTTRVESEFLEVVAVRT